jgi:hypothetical protein
MKKSKLTVALAILLSSSILLSSCIGSFGLTKKVYSWNNSLGNKFVNELVFICANIIPVYSVSVWIDAVVLNSIEFWTGNKVIASTTKEIKGEKVNYLLQTNSNGYVITNETTHQVVSLNFDKNNKSWSIASNGQSFTLLTFVDDNHVKMYNPNGQATTVELSQAGVLAYRQMVNNSFFACK